MNRSLKSKLLSPDDAAQAILAGGVGVIPTDTLYGIAVGAFNPEAVTRFYALKRREHKPGTIIAANIQQLLELGVPSAHIDRVKHLWPNPLSIETPLGDELSYLHQETGRQGFRVVADPLVRAFLEKTGPLVTSSANQPGEPVSASVEQAWDYFGDSVDFYIDGGNLEGRLPSTLISVSPDGNISVIREGAIKISDLPTL